MDTSSTWLSHSQQGMQDQGFINQVMVDSFVDQVPACIKEMTNIKRLPPCKTANNIINNPHDENPKSKPKPLHNIPNTFTISFGDIKPKDEVIWFTDSFGYASGTKKGMIRNRIQLQDHMLAERKRREKVARRFISLSALLPGLKKGMQDQGFIIQVMVDSFVDQVPACIKEMTNIKRLPPCKTANNIINNPHDENPKSKPKPLHDIPNTFTISFGDIKPKDEVISFTDSFGYASGTKKGMIRNRIQLQDHMLAERKRREKVARRFISLSALLPGLKKMDKATVLEDAADYIQELQWRVKELEGLSCSKTHNTQPVIISSKKPKLSCSEYDGTFSGEPVFGGSPSPNPDIAVRMSGSSVLVRIYCQKNYLSFVKAFSEMQKLGFSVTSSNALPFADTTLLITIVAKKKDDFLMTSTDLAKNLKLAMRTLDAIQFQIQDYHSKTVH